MSKRRAVLVSVNIVPYLDVMLVLLVIFMATTPVIQMGVNLDLPQGSPVVSERVVMLSIDKSGKRFVQINDGLLQRVRVRRNYQIILYKIKCYRRAHRTADRGSVADSINNAAGSYKSWLV